ncbi:MAG TPA: chemotaxis protein CheW [Terriglobia bacterium]|nr:chemotaxis protein CheW [Terriglobia bacterium]
MKEDKTMSGQPVDAHPEPDRAGGIDWGQIHRRLEVSQAALERRLTPGREEEQKILRTRAKLLAREQESKRTPGPSLEVVEFLLGYEHYAIESSYIREIYPLRDLTPLPGTPPFVLGLINVRGQVLSIIDIRKFFDLPEKGLTDLNKVMVVRAGQMELGILADAILGVRSITIQSLQPSLPTLTGIRAEYLRGVTKDPLVVLDAEKLLSDRRIIVDEDVDRATNGFRSRYEEGERK